MEKFKVLIADDVKIIAQTNKIIAEKNSNIVVVGLVYDGQQEYESIKELEPDIVITDNQMPYMNGVEVVQKVCDSNLDKKPKFILVTSDYGTEFNKNCFEMGISAVVNKKTREVDLRYAIIDVINELDSKKFLEDQKKWHKKYATEEIIDLKKYLLKEDFEILKKLGIAVLDKIYTAREFDVLDEDYILYYYDDNMNEEEKADTKSLENTGVTREEYNQLLDKLHKINLEINS